MRMPFRRHVGEPAETSPLRYSLYLAGLPSAAPRPGLGTLPGALLPAAGIVLALAAASGCSPLSSAIIDPYSTGRPAYGIVPWTDADYPGPSAAMSPSLPSPLGLDDYKALVAQHVVQHNRDHLYSGTLPPLLPAVVVLNITVDEAGHMTAVEVVRSRDPDASLVALAAMWRSVPLPRPRQLARAGGKLTFAETFLFADRERYQLRSLAGPQSSE